MTKPLNLILLIIFGCLDFHFQESIPKTFDFIFGPDPSRLILIPLIIYMLLPWYLLSLWAYTNSGSEYTLKKVTRVTVSYYMIAVLSYYTYYSILTLGLNYGNFFGQSYSLTESVSAVFTRLFIPGVIEWGPGSIAFGVFAGLLNWALIPQFKKALPVRTKVIDI